MYSPKRDSNEYPSPTPRSTSPFFGADMSSTEIQEKISAARREADGLKDKIKIAKDQTADTSCEYTFDNIVCRLTPSARHGQ